MAQAAAPTAVRRSRTDRIADRVNWVMATQVLAAVAAFAVGARPELINGVFLGTLVGLALTPLWLPNLYRYRGAVLLFVVAIFALLNGGLLTALNPAERDFSRALMQSQTGMFLILIISFGVFLWARTVLGPAWATVWAGLGMVGGGLLQPAGIGSPWKHDIGLPITLIVLALVARRGPRPWMEVPIALVLAGLFAVNDARSLFGILLMAAMVCAVQALLPAGDGRKRNLILPLAFLVAAGFAAYRVTIWAILQGYLGEDARIRQVQQTAQSGNVLTAGRPEMGASIELLAHQPWGIGHGLEPSRGDVSVAAEGMAEVSDRFPDPGYLIDYMLSFGFTLHSFAAEHWIRYGFGGLALVLVFAGLTIAGLLRLLALRRLTTFVTFAAFNSLWNLLFSPTLDATFPLALSTALILRALWNTEQETWDPVTRVGSPWHRAAAPPGEFEAESAASRAAAQRRRTLAHARH